MSHIRWAGIPIDHLVAEIAAFPLASEAALRLGITELTPWLIPERGLPTAHLWRAAEQSLAGHAPNVSLDELTAMRDRTWFRPESVDELRAQPLHKYLRLLAGRHLRVRGATAVPCLQLDHWHDGLDSDALSKMRSREAWRWLTFALPSDMLLAALGDARGSPTRVEMLSPQLEENLHRRGFAEAHLHVNAGLDFPLLWTSAMHGLKSDQLDETAFRSPGADLNEGRNFGNWLLRVALARYLLAAFLRRRAVTSSETLRLVEFFEAVRGELYDRLGSHGGNVLQDALRDLDRGEFVGMATYADLRECYVLLTSQSHQSFPRRAYPVGPHPVSPSDRPQLNQAFAADPIALFFPAGDAESPTPEMAFFSAGLRYAELANFRDPKTKRTVDPEFLSLFWQTVRVRSLFYRHVVQRPMTPGLQWFVRTYGRLGPGRRSIGPGLQLESAAITSGLGHGLRALEIRTCPEDSSSRLLEYVDEVDDHFRLLAAAQKDVAAVSEPHLRDATSPVTECEFGIVLHFAKDRGGGAREGVPNGFWIGSHADPSTVPKLENDQTGVANPTGYRFANFYQTTIRRHAQSFASLIQGFPRSLAVVRGVDVCTDELGVPAWVVAPAFRYLRDVSSQVSFNLLANHGIRVPPLRTTVHAGEDYVHLMTGLRNIEWSLRYLGLREGDRIGHAVALGVDASQWAKSAGRIAMMREERLFDLVFEWHCYAAENVSITDSRRTYLDRELARLSQLVFGRAVPPHELETMIELLHDENFLARMGFPEGQPRPMPSLLRTLDFHESIKRGQQIAKRYLQDPVVFHRGRVLEWLDPASESDVLEQLQNYLRERVGIQGLAVEANVSSNLLIANLGSLEHHPLWRLSPPRPHPKLRPVNLVLGSDDPITFASNLPNEYALVRDALVRGDGLSDTEANAWLDHVRESSLGFRFTLPRPQFDSIKSAIDYSNDWPIRPLL